MPRKIETIFVPANKDPKEQYKRWRESDGKQRKSPIVKYEPVMGGTKVVISYEVLNAG